MIDPSLVLRLRERLCKRSPRSSLSFEGLWGCGPAQSKLMWIFQLSAWVRDGIVGKRRGRGSKCFLRLDQAVLWIWRVQYVGYGNAIHIKQCRILELCCFFFPSLGCVHSTNFRPSDFWCFTARRTKSGSGSWASCFSWPHEDDLSLTGKLNQTELYTWIICKRECCGWCDAVTESLIRKILFGVSERAI